MYAHGFLQHCLIYEQETGEHRIIKEMWTDAERQADNGGKPGKGKNLEERMRSNDGAVDAEGRFYVGAMNDPAVVGNGNFTDEGAWDGTSQKKKDRKRKTI